MTTIGRLPQEVLKAHQSINLKLIPICCDTIDNVKKQFENTLKQRPTTTLKNMIEVNGESKKGYNISAGKICILCSTTKLPNSGIGKNKYYKLDIKNDIKFLGNNRYQIYIPGKKYSLHGVLNTPDINIILNYNYRNGTITYKVPGYNIGTIILNKTNLINPTTIFKDRIAKTKINFRVQNRYIELIFDFPIKQKSINNMNYKDLKLTA